MIKFYAFSLDDRLSPEFPRGTTPVNKRLILKAS